MSASRVITRDLAPDEFAVQAYESADKRSNNTSERGAIPDWPFRCLFTGPPNCGKTSSILNLVRACAIVHGPIDSVQVVHLDEDTHEFDALKPDRIIGHKSLMQKDGERFVPSYGAMDKSKRNLVIIEELGLDRLPSKVQSALETLFTYASSHGNCSLCFGYQRFFRVPTLVRDCCDSHVFFRTTNKKDLTNVAHCVGIPLEQLQELFREHLLRQHDSISIWKDRNSDSPFHMRINLFGPVLRRIS